VSLGKEGEEKGKRKLLIYSFTCREEREEENKEK
jgi:hypothetical protein